MSLRQGQAGFAPLEAVGHAPATPPGGPYGLFRLQLALRSG